MRKRSNKTPRTRCLQSRSRQSPISTAAPAVRRAQSHQQCAHIKNTDELVYQPNGTYKAVGETSRKGFELETRYQFSPALSMDASYANQLEAETQADSKLPLPKHLLKTGVQYRTSLGEGALTLNADASMAKGIPYYMGAVEKSVTTHLRYDLRASYDWTVSLFALHHLAAAPLFERSHLGLPRRLADCPATAPQLWRHDSLFLLMKPREVCVAGAEKPN